MPSSSFGRSSTSHKRYGPAGLTIEDIDLLVTLRSRARWQRLWMVVFGLCLVAAYFAVQSDWPRGGILACVLGAGMAGAQAMGNARDTTRLLERYVRQDKAVLDQIEMLDGTRLKRRLATKHTKTDST